MQWFAEETLKETSHGTKKKCLEMFWEFWEVYDSQISFQIVSLGNCQASKAIAEDFKEILEEKCK